MAILLALAGALAGLFLLLLLLARLFRRAGAEPVRPHGPGGAHPAAPPAPVPHLPAVAAAAGVGPRSSPPVRLAPRPMRQPAPLASSPERVTPAARRAAGNSGASRFSPASRPARVQA
ncbi:hypothetical protein [Couchioplanes caeruleus]|nr:hypothetical protein [Couchioplanes caeruleus]